MNRRSALRRIGSLTLGLGLLGADDHATGQMGQRGNPDLRDLLVAFFSGLAAAFVASLFWMAAIQRFPLSYAYPFMSLTYVLVFGLAFFLFGDAMNTAKVAGLVLICSGVALIARGG